MVRRNLERGLPPTFIPTRYKSIFVYLSDCDSKLMAFKKIFQLPAYKRHQLFVKTLGIENATDPELIFQTICYVCDKLDSGEEVVFSNNAALRNMRE